MFDNEILCHCGKKGCLETEASGSALHRILYERYKAGSSTILSAKIDKGEGVGLYDLIDAIQKEDVLSIEILEQMGVNLGKGIAGLMNIFNPELVILGGVLFQSDEYLLLPVKSAIRKYSLNLVSQDTEFKISKLKERAGIIGACLLARSKVLGMI
jgi:predicted NBD/HSP70 family sugar kinase